MIINPKEIVDKEVIKNARKHEFEVQQNGIDLTLDAAFRLVGPSFLGKQSKVMPAIEPAFAEGSDCVYEFKPGEAYSIEFGQDIEVPEDMCAQIIQRSTLNRMGAYIIAGLYDSGFKNQIGAILRTNVPIKIEVGARIAQIIFMKADAASQYDGQYQKR